MIIPSNIYNKCLPNTIKLSIFSSIFHQHYSSSVKYDVDSISPTEQEIIDNLSLFKLKKDENNENIPKNYSYSRLNYKKRYISKKISVVQSKFGENSMIPGYLNYSIPEPLQSPFINGLPEVKPPQRQKRLSVTSLLTKSWCELRNAYDIYSQLPRFSTEQLISGTTQHSSLEDKIYPLNEKLIEFKKQNDIKPDRFLGSWVSTLSRLLYLFISGEAREINCHTFMNSKDNNFAFLDNETNIDWEKLLNDTCGLETKEDPGKDIVLISGIIDHLTLRDKCSEKITPLNDLPQSNDINEIINLLRQYKLDNLEILVSDIKTRQLMKTPSQNSVVKASKLQVMYYRYFLELFGKDPYSTYMSLLLNANRRGYDIDKPIEPLKIISTMIEEPLLIPDMMRLQNGNPINVDYYNDQTSRNTVEYDLSEYKDMVSTFGQQGLVPLCDPWKKPVTLRYFAARLSQLYNIVGKMLSNSLLIEYYCHDRNFHNFAFEFDLQTLKENHKDSSRFWFGKRRIEPIQPSLKNFSIFCKHCDYAPVCSWKYEGEQKCKELGNELKDIIINN